MRPPSVLYQQEFLTPEEADQWLVWLQTVPRSIGNKSRLLSSDGGLQHLDIGWIGDEGLNYRYTGLDHKSSGWPPALISPKSRIEAKAAQRFNFLLLNRYRSGHDYMGWHRDDEAGCHGDIASLSLGAQRRFRIEQDSDRTRRHIDRNMAL